MHAFRNLSSPTIIAAQSPLPMASHQVLSEGFPCPFSHQINSVESGSLFNVSQLEPYVPEQPRVPRRFREVRYIPGEPGKVRNIVQRLPTPPQQIIERVNVMPTHQPVINYASPTLIQQALPAPAPQIFSQQTAQVVSQNAPQFISQPASQFIAQPAFIQQPFGGCCNNAYQGGFYRY